MTMCFWHPDYVPSPPFCLTSKLSEAENRILADFEDIKYLENLQIHQDLISSPRSLRVGGLDNQVQELQIQRRINAKKAVQDYFTSLKRFRFKQPQKHQKGFGLYNIQTNGGTVPKSGQIIKIIKSDFLTR